ncbi:hypothetical protein Tco_0952244 [Tanacetum coccineum]|uniref:Uncharacterized protein n=1 Tax=Tanacetum coccineum TaxID=301880 RepID=A0ABQ5E2E9_9ASTR
MILGRPFMATIHAQIDVFKREISLGFREDRVLFDMDGNICHSNIFVENVYMTNSIQNEEPFNPFKIGEDLFSYESPSCLQFEKRTRFCDDESIDTVDTSDDMQEPGVEHKEYDAIYRKGENGMLEQWMCFRDHERQSINGNSIIFTDFLKVRYGNKTIDDTTHERRYYEWVAQNSDFKDNDILNEWVLDSFDVKADYGKTYDDPYSRRFDEYKKENAKSSMRAHHRHGTTRDSKKKNDGKVVSKRQTMNHLLLTLKHLKSKGRIRAFEQERRDLDVEIKQMKELKANYGVTSPRELRHAWFKVSNGKGKGNGNAKEKERAFPLHRCRLVG